ncbi:MAG: helix-hairpin-helix domain-containing protein [Halobacteriaceae archaeon]
MTGEATRLEDVHLVGSVTASVLADADIDPEDLLDRRVTHAELRDVGVNPGVAARLRRAHSLPWAHAADSDDLDRRAEQIRGLDRDERAWVAVSASDWTETLDREIPTSEEATTDDEHHHNPDRTPVTSISGIGEVRAAALADAGITSVRALAGADPEAVASALDLSPVRVRQWHAEARERQE